MKMKLFFLAILLIGAYAQEAVSNTTASNTPANDASSEEANIKEKFDRFVRKWKKSYATEEERTKRFHIFRHNYKMAEAMSKGTGQNVYGVTKFFDMEVSDFEKKYGGLDVNFVDMMKTEVEFEDFSDVALEQVQNSKNSTEDSNDTTLRHLENDYVYSSDEDFESDDPQDDPNWDLPEPFGIKSVSLSTESNLRKGTPHSWDWRAKGAVSFVRNQGVCGACWAFTTVSNIEGLYFNKHNELKHLSEQELLDCNTSNSGCNGGTLPIALNYVKTARGITERNKYPYIGQQTMCKSEQSGEKFGQIKGFTSPGMDEKNIKNMLYSKGPLSAAINSRPLYFYRGGIYDPSQVECNPFAVNHGVTIVGYGTQDGVDYWVIKNSWGPNWGEKGYFRIRRGTGACGINRMVYSGVLA